MIEKKIDGDARNRNVEPYRISVTGDFSVSRKLSRDGVEHRAQNERQNYERKQNVRYQKEKIKITNRAFSAEFIRWIRQVIRNVTNQKNRAERESRDHRQTMNLNLSAFDENERGDQKDSRQSINRADHMRQRFRPAAKIKLVRKRQQNGNNYRNDDRNSVYKKIGFRFNRTYGNFRFSH
jgi:hypothetical protein